MPFKPRPQPAQSGTMDNLINDLFPQIRIQKKLEAQALPELPPNIPTKFWCDNPDVAVPVGSECCFNHWIGLPRDKIGDPKPIFDYEVNLYQDLLDHKYIWIKKARGLGITEFFLR